jgi:hypothetical protein
MIEDKIQEEVVLIKEVNKVEEEVNINPIGGEARPNKLIDDEVRIIPRKPEFGLTEEKTSTSEVK